MVKSKKVIAMIPARLGSQRLKKKNLQLLKDEPLIVHAIRKAKRADIFDEIWVNTESEDIGKYAESENVKFHKRPEALASNSATSEDFVYEFLKKHECDYLVQLHSIAPLLSVEEIRDFTQLLKTGAHDVLLSTDEILIECAYRDKPINFTYAEKSNSQELTPIQRITWSITGWKSTTYKSAYEGGECATYSGKVGYFKINKMAGHIIKTLEDLKIADALFEIVE